MKDSLTKKTTFKVVLDHKDEITEQDLRDMINWGLYSGRAGFQKLQSTISTYSVEEKKE